MKRHTNPLPKDLAARKGAELRRDYEDRVNCYWKIVEVAGGRPTQDGSRVSDSINLRPRNLPVGAVAGIAVVRFCTYQNAGTAAGSQSRSVPRPFGVEVTFRDKDQHPVGTELFGAPAYNFFGLRPPVFIRNPGSRFEEPFGDEAAQFDYGGEYPWDTHYLQVAGRLCPMIRGALETQRILITDLQDPALNPRYAALAQVELTIP